MKRYVIAVALGAIARPLYARRRLFANAPAMTELAAVIEKAWPGIMGKHAVAFSADKGAEDRIVVSGPGAAAFLLLAEDLPAWWRVWLEEID